MSEYANCIECMQAREKRVLDGDGVCVRCKLTVIKYIDNPELNAR